MKRATQTTLRRFIATGLVISLLAACNSAASTVPPVALPPTPASVEVALKPAVPAVVTPIPYDSLVRLFDYDQTSKVDIRETNVVANDDFIIHDISFESPKGGWVSAYLVTPTGEGPFAGIIFLHPGGDTKLEEGKFVSDYDSAFDRAGFKLTEAMMSPDLMMAWEKTSLYGDGRNAVFFGSHTEFVTEKQFAELLKKLDDVLAKHKPKTE